MIEGEERISSRLHAEHGAQAGLESQTPEIMTKAEIKSPRLNRLNHAGALTLEEEPPSFYNEDPHPPAHRAQRPSAGTNL